MAFIHFGKLPFELRMKIWTNVCFQARNVPIIVDDLGPVKIASQPEEVSFCSYCYRAPLAPFLSVLHVDREARTEALNHYRLILPTNHEFFHITTSTKEEIYFNPDYDRLCIHDPMYLRFNRIQDPYRDFARRVLRLGVQFFA